MRQTIGILGGGQLGRMLALASYPLGAGLRCLDPVEEASIDVLVRRMTADYSDEAALSTFADGLDCITYEFENVPVATARFLERMAPVYPPPAALEVSQDRLVEKTFLRDHGIPTPAFAAVMTRADLDEAVERIGLPAVLKTRRMGYDGKGQLVLRSIGEFDAGWNALGGVPLILESFVPFDRELSIIAARGRDGSVVWYPLVQNTHRGGILRLSLARLNATPELQAIAKTTSGASSSSLIMSAFWRLNFSRSAANCWRTKWRHASITPGTGRSRARRPANSPITCAPSWGYHWAAPRREATAPCSTALARCPTPPRFWRCRARTCMTMAKRHAPVANWDTSPCVPTL